MKKIGPFSVENPFILAPMAGITNSPFRRLMRRLRSEIVISELISANGLQFASERTHRMMDYHDDERIVGLQIFGEDGDLLVQACKRVEAAGVDFVDLNLGCPVSKIVKKGAGAALCREPLELGKILKQMVDSVKIPVTIKIRTGWDENSKNALEIVRVAADAGVKWVAIHGRTRAQGYSGLADWDFIGDIKAKSPIPILGNGDVNTPEQAVNRYLTYGVDGVLIGRGALRNPFIFEQALSLLRGEKVRTVGSEDLIQVMNEQKILLEEVFDSRTTLLQVRKFLAWYSSGYPGSSEFRRKVFSVSEPEKIWDEAHIFFKGSLQRSQEYLKEAFLMGGHG